MKSLEPVLSLSWELKDVLYGNQICHAFQGVNAVTIDACCSGNAACVIMLLEHGARPEPDPKFVFTLHEAVKRGNWIITAVLTLLVLNVKGCIAPGFRARSGWSLLKVTGSVQKFFWPINEEAPQLETPLYTACVYQRTKCVRQLLDLGTDH
ncbi:ankyrin repeat and SOCS box protein 11 [Microcaecilia unicolor]|uniref:Ankyrin repeat and SOCS box protein 11-like n=1 Tax=Microcaecilia unicolor TaxID=1415580 RepID=A0A6P7XJ40_9AMPH|nr:ankyrin repeat and SOCS box protein 11-like [Microcaecilia unicolor]